MSAPLAGTRVLELARVPPAELPGMMLADLGADVIKIEAPAAAPLTDADKARAVAVPVNRNKRSIVLDLKSAGGRQMLHRLAATADVIVEGFRPGTTARLGADYATLRGINSRLVYCSLSAYGQTGPYRDLAGHDLNFMALSGALSLIGPAGHPPSIPLNLVADYGGAALHAAFGIMVALFARERTGTGEQIDVSYLDTTVALLSAVPGMHMFGRADAPLARGQGFLAGTFAYYGVYETLDGQYMSVACVEPHFWERFCRTIGRPDLVAEGPRPGDDRGRPDARQLRARETVAAVMRTKTRREWSELLLHADVCVAPVVRADECASDPQVLARGMSAVAPHSLYGGQPQAAPPVRYSSTTTSIRTAAPWPGEHSDVILAELSTPPPDAARLT